MNLLRILILVFVFCNISLPALFADTIPHWEIRLNHTILASGDAEKIPEILVDKLSVADTFEVYFHADVSYFAPRVLVLRTSKMEEIIYDSGAPEHSGMPMRIPASQILRLQLVEGTYKLYLYFDFKDYAYQAIDHLLAVIHIR